jgi:hypothetical protein
MTRPGRVRRFGDALLLVSATLLALLLAEGACRFVLYRKTPDALVFDDELIYTCKPFSTVFGQTLNDIGCIGPDVLTPKPPEERRVFLLGGSTSFSREYVDATAAALSRSNPQCAVKVVSCGRPRYTSYTNLANFRENLLQHSPDVIVCYLGINDSIYNSFHWIDTVPDVGRFNWRSLEASMFYKMIKYYLIDRRLRAESDFSEGEIRSTDILRKNLSEIIRIAGANDIGVVLATFAISYPTDDETLRKIIEDREDNMKHFWGNIPSTVHAVERHNEVMEELASEHGLSLARVQGSLPADAEHFIDMCHMTPRGKTILGTVIAEAIGCLDSPSVGGRGAAPCGCE